MRGNRVIFLFVSRRLPVQITVIDIWSRNIIKYTNYILSCLKILFKWVSGKQKPFPSRIAHRPTRHPAWNFHTITDCRQMRLVLFISLNFLFLNRVLGTWSKHNADCRSRCLERWSTSLWNPSVKVLKSESWFLNLWSICQRALAHSAWFKLYHWLTAVPSTQAKVPSLRKSVNPM